MTEKELFGKTVAITGSTGGIGKELCNYLAGSGANLILCDRNREKSENLRSSLLQKYDVNIDCVTVDLSNIRSVMNATDILKNKSIDVLIHNAGAYKIPRKICDTGYDNVFEINFVSPYYMTRELLPALRERNGKVVAVGSIAHNYSKTDSADIDFHTEKTASKVYGNSKRFLMFSLYELMKNENEVSLSVVHPGITFTNITSHYPKLIFAIIKYPMKLIFMKPKYAALSIFEGTYTDCGYMEWIGPRYFNIWGFPNMKKLKTCSIDESKAIFATAEEVYLTIKST